MEAPRFQESAHEDGKVVSPTHWPSLPPPPGNIPGTHFCYRLSHTQGHSAVGLCQRKIPMIPSGIKPATFWLVVQYLDQLHHHVTTVIVSYIYLLQTQVITSI
jgi:hypothetical protein